MLVISLIGVILTGVFVPWLKTKASSEKLNIIQMWVNIAVAAAEQIFRAPGSGPSKKMYVMEFLQNKGITITDQELDALIEAAVYEINRAKYMLFEDLSIGDSYPPEEGQA